MGKLISLRDGFIPSGETWERREGERRRCEVKRSIHKTPHKAVRDKDYS